jgi:hypothetical protein
MKRDVKGVLIFSGVVVKILVLLSFSTTFEGIPKTWDMDAIKKFHLPPPDTTVRVNYAGEDYYNSLPEHVIYKTYPYYYREFEKPGYLDSLRKLSPEVVFDPSRLHTQEDWIKAGELVFNWPVAYTSFNDKVSRVEAKGSSGKIPRDGTYPFSRYVIDGEGKLLIGSMSCASCHTRVLESGEVVTGGQGNTFNNVGFANAIVSGRIPFPVLQEGASRLHYTPWAPADHQSKPSNATEFADYIRAPAEGVIDRQGISYLYPLAVPSLIGIKDIKYLDRTGLMKHEGPGDLMRYSAFNQGMDMLTSYNGYIPGGKNMNSELPSAQEWNHPFGYVGRKYSDEQLYALTQFIYSLRPPKNPNRFPEEMIKRGNAVFTRSGCITCHTPPLYTNNKLTPANGFEPPEEHFKKYDIFNVSVETDSVSTLYSRRGTGYYKIPSLRGLWFQSAFFHNGNLATLEEVFDPRRLQQGYVPRGYKPPHLKTMAVKGHPFGFELNEKDKKALIAFLKTL